MMSSFYCESGPYNGPIPCLTTTPGGSVPQPVTLNIYNPGPAGSNTIGSLITSVDQTIAMPFRPSPSLTQAAPCSCGRPSGSRSLTTLVTTASRSGHVQLCFLIAAFTEPTGVDSRVRHVEERRSSGLHPQRQCPADNLELSVTTSHAAPSVGADASPAAVLRSSHVFPLGRVAPGLPPALFEFRLDSTTGCWTDLSPDGDDPTSYLFQPTTLPPTTVPTRLIDSADSVHAGAGFQSGDARRGCSTPGSAIRSICEQCLRQRSYRGRRSR